MTEPDTQFHYHGISLCLYTYLDETEYTEVFKEVKSIDLPDGFANRIVDIDEKDISNCSLYFGESGSESPESTSNQIELNFIEENGDEFNTHIHLHSDSKTLDNSVSILDEILDIVNGAEVRYTTFEAYAFMDFHRLRLPIQSDSEKTPTGIRFEEDGYDYLIQVAPEDPLPEDQDAAIFARMYLDHPEVEISEASIYIDEEVNSFEEYIVEQQKES